MADKKFLGQFLTPAVIGVGVLVLTWLRLRYGQSNIPFATGFACGLLLGLVALGLLQISSKPKLGWRAWHKVAFFLGLIPLAFFSILSKHLAYSYVLGFSVTFCFGSSLETLIKYHSKKGKTGEGDVHK